MASFVQNEKIYRIQQNEKNWPKVVCVVDYNYLTSTLRLFLLLMYNAGNGVPKSAIRR